MFKKKVPGYISYIMMFIIAICVSFAIIRVLSFVLKTNLPLAVVSSWSMEPTLHIGDMIIVGGEECEIGDIIVYKRGKYIVHRVISKSNKDKGYTVITKGDANFSPDIAISANQVEGKVIFVVPYLGVIKLFSDKISSILLAVLFFGIMWSKMVG